jgi:hypothetical protein
VVLAVIALAQLVPTAKAQPQAEHKRVLVLYSTRRDGQFSIVGESELPRILDDGLARNMGYYSEFIDLSRFPDTIYRSASVSAPEISGCSIDLVIAMGHCSRVRW